MKRPLILLYSYIINSPKIAGNWARKALIIWAKFSFSSLIICIIKIKNFLFHQKSPMSTFQQKYPGKLCMILQNRKLFAYEWL